MPAVRIIEPGPCSTVQDLGRHGHAAIGVSTSGAADQLSLRIGNRLLGNPDGAAAIEATLIGPIIEAIDQAIPIAITGASVRARIETPTGTRPAPAWRAIELPPGARLVFEPFTRGCRVYIACAGGFQTPPTLGSRSTHIATGIGGRPLCAGQTLPVARPTDRPPSDPPSDASPPDLRDLIRSIFSPCLRITLASETAHHIDTNGPLFNQSYTIDRDSDRIGIRLHHTNTPITIPKPDAPSEATMFGTIQATPDQLIILGPDAAPTGGYPAIGTVIAADLDALAQKRPGEAITLQPITHQEAWHRWREREALLERLLPPSQTATNDPR